MKIKLSNDQSRKKIEHLNHKLKNLANDIKGEDYHNMNNLMYKSNATNLQSPVSKQSVSNQQNFLGLSHKNYFKSATNLNSHHNNILNSRYTDYNNNPNNHQEAYNNNGMFDSQQQNPNNHGFIQHQSSPKFSIIKSPISNYQQHNQSPKQPQQQILTSSNYLAQKSRTQKLNKQLKQIIQNKKQFHSLIKKELSELEKLEQMMVEQPERWDVDEKEFGEGYVRQKGYDGSNENSGDVERNNNTKKVFFKDYANTKKHQKQAQPQNNIMKNTKISSHLLNQNHMAYKTPTQQSQYQQSQYHPSDDKESSLSSSQNQIMSKNYHNNQKQQYLKSYQHHSSLINQEQQSHQAQHEFIQNNNENSSSNLNTKSRYQHYQQLLKDFLVVDYSESNIRSLIAEQQQQNSRISKSYASQLSQNNSSLIENKSSNSNSNQHSKINLVNSPSQNNPNNNKTLAESSYNNIKKHHNSNNGSIVGSSSVFYNKDTIKEHQDEQSHYQLVHKFKLLELVLKIKYFNKFRKGLKDNLSQRRKYKKASNNYINKLLVKKSFISLFNHKQQSIKQQLLLFKIKTLYVRNMLKKSSLQTIQFNSKYKTYKFCSQKLQYQKQLLEKSKFFSQFRTSKSELEKQNQLHRLSESYEKKSLFKTIKQRYEKLREVHSKYKVVKNVNKHRVWKELVNVMRFNLVKKLMGNQRYSSRVEQQNTIHRERVTSSESSSNHPNHTYNASIVQSLLSNFTFSSPREFLESINQLTLQSLQKINQQYQSSYTSSSNPYSSDNNSFQSHEIDSNNMTGNFNMQNEQLPLVQYTQPMILQAKQQLLRYYLKFMKYGREFVGGLRKERDNRIQSLKKYEAIQRKYNMLINQTIKPNRKKQFVNKLRDNLIQEKITEKIQYFCNLNMGKVPQNIRKRNKSPYKKPQDDEEIQNLSFSEENSLMEQSDDNEDRQKSKYLINSQIDLQNQANYHRKALKGQSNQQNMQSLSPQSQPQASHINPLLKKYYKYLFVKNLHLNYNHKQKQKLQKQIYYETIYCQQLMAKCFKGWVSWLKQLKQQNEEKQKQKHILKLKEIQQQQKIIKIKADEQKSQRQQKRLKQQQKQRQLQKQQQLILERKRLLEKEQQDVKLRVERLRKEQEQKKLQIQKFQKELEQKKMLQREELQMKMKLQQQSYLVKQSQKNNSNNIKQNIQTKFIQNSLLINKQFTFPQSSAHQSQQQSQQISNSQNQPQQQPSEHSPQHFSNSQAQKLISKAQQYQQSDNSEQQLQQQQQQQQNLHKQPINDNQASNFNSHNASQTLVPMNQQSIEQTKNNQNQSQMQDMMDWLGNVLKKTKVVDQNFNKQKNAQLQKSDNSQQLFKSYNEDIQEDEQSQIGHIYSKNNEMPLKMKERIDYQERGQETDKKIDELQRGAQQNNSMNYYQQSSEFKQQQEDNDEDSCRQQEVFQDENEGEEKHQIQGDQDLMKYLQDEDSQQNNEQEQQILNKHEQKPQNHPNQISQSQNQSQNEQFQNNNPSDKDEQQVENQHPSFSLQSQEEQQFQSQQNQSILQSSTSPQHKRLLSYATNHHQRYVKKMIFNHVFKYQEYKEQQKEQTKLLRDIFMQWRRFVKQKNNVRRYLDVYDQIEGRISKSMGKVNINQRLRRQERYIVTSRRTGVEKTYSQQRVKPSNNKPQKSHSLNSRTSQNKNQKIYKLDNKSSSKQSNSYNIPFQYEVPLKYFPHSSEDKQKFQQLYQSQQ